MSNQRIETESERTLRRKLFCRLVLQGLVFFGLFLVTAVALEFLWGPPQRPTLDVVRQTFQRHGVLFAAIFALAPIAVRDVMKSTLQLVRTHVIDAETTSSQSEADSRLAQLNESISATNHVERLHEIVTGSTNTVDEKREPETKENRETQNQKELVEA